MTPPIRDASSARFSPRMHVISLRRARYFFACVLLLAASASATKAAPPQASQDSNAKPASNPAAQRPPENSSNPSTQKTTEKSTEPTPLQKAAHQKKVITEDDLAKPAKPISLDDLDGEENNPVCDLSCEAELRAEMGFGPEREAEFRNLLTLARHEIAGDKAWNATLQDALDAASGYCDIQRQQAQIVGKGIVSQYTKDNVHSQFAERERKLVLQYRNAAGLIAQRVQVVQRFAPLRATVMQYQWNEASARACPDYTLP